MRGRPFSSSQSLNLLDGKGPRDVPVRFSGRLNEGKQAFAIAYCQSGASLDLTRGLEIWVFVQWTDADTAGLSSEKFQDYGDDWLQIIPGIGVGTYQENGDICLSSFAKELLKVNLRSLVPDGSSLRLEIVLPKGKDLAIKTSNASFGVVDGLALIGTQAEVQDSASPDQLQKTLQKLREQSVQNHFEGRFVFVIGENGLLLAQEIGIPFNLILKVGNWLGPALVAAAEVGVKELLLFGYHGKLVKLAGGVFHTHHHLADARLEILTSLAVKEELSVSVIRLIADAESMEAAFRVLSKEQPDLASKLWNRLAVEVEMKSLIYIARYGSWSIKVGSALFDRERCLRWVGPNGMELLGSLGVHWEDVP